MTSELTQARAAPTDQDVATAFIDAMTRVYTWMTAGLLITAIVAALAANNPGIANLVYGNPLAALLVTGAQFGLLFAITALIDKTSPVKSLGMFFGYAATMGITMSVVFMSFKLGTIWLAFGATALTFAAMSLVELTTKKDLSSLGPVVCAALLGLIGAMVLGWIFDSSAFDRFISAVGVLVFMGITVYDSQRIKVMTREALSAGDAAAVNRVGVLGALNLYLDLLNLFLLLLRSMGEED